MKSIMKQVSMNVMLEPVERHLEWLERKETDLYRYLIEMLSKDTKTKEDQLVIDSINSELNTLEEIIKHFKMLVVDISSGNMEKFDSEGGGN